MKNEEDVAITLFGGDAKIISPIMGGMMNQSYLVESKGEKYILYIPTEQANEMVDRNLEKETEGIARKLGLTSESFFFDAKTGIKARHFIDGSSIDKTKGFDYDEVAKLMHALHDSGIKASQDYHPFKRFLDYESEAKGFVHRFSDQYETIRACLFEHQKELESHPLVLCHNDAQKSNIVASAKGYYFIDFEFAANNDPLYDVACFGNGSVEEGYKLLKGYKGASLTKEDEATYYLWRMFISLQWHNVALVKDARGEGATHGYDFKAVAAFFLANAAEAHRRFLAL